MIDSILMTGNEFADWLEKKYLDWQYINGRASIRKWSQWLGISHSAVINMMNGKTKPGPQVLPLLAEKLGFTVYDVLGEPRPDEIEAELIQQYRSIPPEQREEFSAALREYVRYWMEKHGYEKVDIVPDNHQDI